MLVIRIFLRNLHHLFADIKKSDINFYILYFSNYLLYSISIKNTSLDLVLKIIYLFLD